MFQKLVIVGRLGANPEMRYTPDGTPVTNFNVAVNEAWTDGSGERVERVTWYRVSAWRRQAEVCNQYLEKGRTVLVEADRIEASPYKGDDGEPRATLEVRARTVRFLGGNGNGSDEAPADEGIPF